jgi:hypothetical protein
MRMPALEPGTAGRRSIRVRPSLIDPLKALATVRSAALKRIGNVLLLDYSAQRRPIVFSEGSNSSIRKPSNPSASNSLPRATVAT